MGDGHNLNVRNLSHTHKELAQINHVAFGVELSKVTGEDGNYVIGERYTCIGLVPPGYLNQPPITNYVDNRFNNYIHNVMFFPVFLS